MAQFVTRKSISSRFITLSTSYCSLQNLFPQSIRNYYWSGVYGWNCDIHFVYLDNSICGEYTIALTTGYRPFGKTVDYKLVEKYDGYAEKLNKWYWDNALVSNVDMHNRHNKIMRYLRKRFVREALR